jgi:V8-like Glu-specific endopeptidase
VVLVTNAHVIDPTPDRRSGGLAPDDLLVSFQALKDVDPKRTFKVASIVWSSEREALDVTIARLVDPPALPDPYPVAGQLPVRKARVVAIGHPGGGTLSLSMNDNELLDYEDVGCKVHYRTPTEGGSSGCPIFTKEWKLIAVHHYGGDALPRLNGQPGTYQANEGISIHAIRQALKSDLALEARSGAAGGRG